MVKTCLVISFSFFSINFSLRYQSPEYARENPKKDLRFGQFGFRQTFVQDGSRSDHLQDGGCWSTRDQLVSDRFWRRVAPAAGLLVWERFVHHGAPCTMCTMCWCW